MLLVDFPNKGMGTVTTISGSTDTGIQTESPIFFPGDLEQSRIRSSAQSVRFSGRFANSFIRLSRGSTVKLDFGHMLLRYVQ